MRDNSSVTVTLCELYCTQSLSQRTDLVNLNENRVGAAFFDTAFKILNIGYEKVVTNELATVADKIGENLPACPVVFSHTVLD